MRKRALQYGLDMKDKGLLGPSPILNSKDIRAVIDQIKLYRIGRIRPSNAFVLERSGYVTIYVRPKYSGYRTAYSRVFPDSLFGKDVDHLHPRSKVSDTEFIALGAIDSKVNRAQNDSDEHENIIQKALNELPKENRFGEARYAGAVRARELGRFVQNGYIKPIEEVNVEALKQIHLAAIFLLN